MRVGAEDLDPGQIISSGRPALKIGCYHEDHGKLVQVRQGRDVVRCARQKDLALAVIWR